MKTHVEFMLELSQGNPGALRVLTELQWYSHWFEYMQTLNDEGIRGGEIWALYKDEYHQDLSKFALHIDDLMMLSKRNKHFGETKLITPRPLRKWRSL